MAPIIILRLQTIWFDINMQENTLLPNSWAMAKAMAVFPVPGGPAIKMARPAILFA